MVHSLHLQNIVKEFPGVRAVDDVSLELEGGKIYGFVGENGAGKSTLMRVLSGIYRADKGTILLDGNKLSFRNYRDAVKKGIGLVPQEISVLRNLSVCENLFLSEPLTKRGLVDWNAMSKVGSAFLKKMDIPIDVWENTKNLTLAQLKMIDIIKVIREDPVVLILDEPTAPLSPDEVKNLFKLLYRLKQEGKIIIFISHRLNEVLEIADDVTVMKDGKLIGTLPRNLASSDKIINMMVGRAIGDLFPPKKSSDKLGDTLIAIERFHLPGWGTEVSFRVYEGEIVGIGGLQGQGQHELIQGLFGLAESSATYVESHGERVIPRNPGFMKRHGFALIPLDRAQQGLLLKRGVGDNLALASLDQYAKFGIISNQKKQSSIMQIVQELGIKASSLQQKVVFLSGGNQQKVVIGKWLLTRPTTMLLIEPTLGVDVATKKDIYFRLRRLARAGVAVILATSDMLELVGLCDRVLVMYEGRITKELVGDSITEENIARASVAA